MKRSGGRRGAFVHLADHERNTRAGQPPGRGHGRPNTTELDQFEVRQNTPAIAANPRDVVRRGDAFIEHHRQRTFVGKVLDSPPITGRNGLFDISQIVDRQRFEILERFDR